MEDDALMSTPDVTIIGGGLAGSEAAWAIAGTGLRVRLYEMRPETMTPAHRTGDLAELVCSNSFRGRKLTQAPGLLKAEMHELGSLVMAAAAEAEVAAGGAWAVDRNLFSAYVTRALEEHPGVEIRHERVDILPEEGPVIVATGPLTDAALHREIVARAGTGSLAFYDAIAPIVTHDSIDWDHAWVQDRWEEPGEGAYVNCPLDRETYEAFVERILAGPHHPFEEFEDAEQMRHFEGCLPIETMAERGIETLRHGPMKPVGLTDPRTGRRPWAVVQLRPDNRARSMLNLVGFQTKMKHGAQKEVLRMIPALSEATFVRLGSMHRNTFLDSPRILDADLSLRNDPRIRFAGQLTGVEGYIESATCGILAGLATAAELRGVPFEAPPATTISGALVRYISDPVVEPFQPMNVNFGLFPDIEEIRDERGKRLKKRRKREFLAERALEDLDRWRTDQAIFAELAPA